jgi:predicted nucleotidyltransferase
MPLRLKSQELDLPKEIRSARQSLTQWPGIRRIWLFGSAAKGRKLDWRSDLDFAVEGLDKHDLMLAWAKLDEAVTWPVDLVRVEETHPALRQEIYKWGQLIHEA